MSQEQPVDDELGPLGRLGVTYRRHLGGDRCERLTIWIGGALVGQLTVRTVPLDERPLIDKLVYALAGNGAMEVL